MTPLEKKGVAEGRSEIMSDCVVFRFGRQIFEIPTIDLSRVGGFYNGYFYEARIKKLRSWKQRRDDVEKRNGKAKKEE